MACQFCKGTGKVQLLLSSVDCDCVSAQGIPPSSFSVVCEVAGLAAHDARSGESLTVKFGSGAKATLGGQEVPPFRSSDSNMIVECGADDPGAAPIDWFIHEGAYKPMSIGYKSSREQLAEDARRFVEMMGNGSGIVLVGAQDKERVIAAMESTGWRYFPGSRCFSSPVRLGIIYLPQDEEGARGYMCNAAWHVGTVTRSMMDVAMLGLRATGSGAVVTSDGARVVEPQRSGFGVSDERFKDMAARCGLGPAQALLMRKANRGEGLWGRACGRTTAMLVEAACALEDGKAVHLVTASIGSREICDRFESLAARAGVRGRISATRTCSWFGGDKPGWTTFVDHDVRVIVSRHAPEEILTLVLSALEQDERTKGMVYRVSVGDDSIALVELGHECAYTVDHSRFLHPEAASEGKAWAAALVDSLWSEWERDAGQRRREAADAVTDIGSLPMDMREQAKAAVQLGKPLRLSGVPGGLVERLKDQGVAVSCEAQGMPMLPRVQLALGGGDPKGVGEFMRMAENLLPRLHSGMVPERSDRDITAPIRERAQRWRERAERAEQEAAEVHERRQQAERARDAAREQAAHWERRAKEHAIAAKTAGEDCYAAVERERTAREEGRREGRAAGYVATARESWDHWNARACAVLDMALDRLAPGHVQGEEPALNAGSMADLLVDIRNAFARAAAGESDTPHGWPEAVERRVRASAARRSVATTLPDGYATAPASPKAAPTNDPESPDGSTHGGWEALYGPDTRTKAYHEARARAERLGLEAAPVDLTKARAAAHADGAREALGKLRRGRSLDDVEADYPGPESFGGEDYPMEAAEQQAPMYRCGCADCPGLPWSPSSSLPHPCGKAAPAEPADCECAMGSARWCSVHGDCTCPRSEDGGWKVIDSPLGTAAETEHDPSCPLLGHGAAEPPAVPPQPEPAPLVMPAAPGPVMVPVPTTAFSNSGVDYSTNYSGPAAPLQGGRDGDPWTLYLWHDIEGAAPRHALRRGSALRASGRADAGRTVSSILDALRAEGATEVRVVLRDPATHTAPQGPTSDVRSTALQRLAREAELFEAHVRGCAELLGECGEACPLCSSEWQDLQTAIEEAAAIGAITHGKDGPAPAAAPQGAPLQGGRDGAGFITHAKYYGEPVGYEFHVVTDRGPRHVVLREVSDYGEGLGARAEFDREQEERARWEKARRQ